MSNNEVFSVDKIRFDQLSNQTVDAWFLNASGDKVVIKNSPNMAQAKAYIQELINLGTNLKTLEIHIKSMNDYETKLKEDIERSAKVRLHYETLLTDIYTLQKV